nr:PREDICTED: tetratricopeptide repeat protein 23-like isoform X3 [Latimeria chalumnae]|eukprot:XP_006007227.1 PREDICTED: tetratricopeptide repeat protein 23-like isoform X3 [Latimeria chalumnae]
MATAEQVQGDHESAIQHLLQAHSILLSKDPSREETAEIAHSLAQAYAASKKEGVNGVIEKYYEDSVSGYKEVLGLENSKCLAVLDDYCQFLILIGKHKQAAVLLLDSLESKKSTFGELSAEVAETYRLLGGIELAQGDQKRAHHKLKKIFGSSWKREKIGYFERETSILCCSATAFCARRGQDQHL